MAELGAGNGTSIPTGIDTRQTYINGPNPRPDSSSRIDAEMANDLMAAVIAMETDIFRTRWIDARTYSTFTEAVAAAANKTLLVCSSVTLDANTTIGATTSLLVLNPGVINANGKTLTINGPVVGNPMHQWLSGFAAGEVTFAFGTINVEWFTLNTDPGSTNMTTALNLAFTQTNCTVILNKGSFRCTANLSDPTCDQIIGAGWNQTSINAAAGVTRVLHLRGTGPTFIDGFSIIGNNTNNAVGLAVGQSVPGDSALVSNITIKDIATTGFTGTDAAGCRVYAAVDINWINFRSAGNYRNIIFDRSTADGAPTTQNFYGGCFRTATKEGITIYSGGEIIFFGGYSESNVEKGMLIDNQAGLGVNTVGQIYCYGFHFENNNTGDTTQYTVKVNSADSGNEYVRLILRDTSFDAGATRANAIHATGGRTEVLVDNPITPSIGSSITWIKTENLAETIVTNWAKHLGAIQSKCSGLIKTYTSGTYTPVATSNDTNIVTDANITENLSRWSQQGYEITVYGSASLNVSNAGRANFGVSLPLSSSITATTDIVGVVTALNNSGTIGGNCGYVTGDATNDRATVEVPVPLVSACIVNWSFSYYLK